MRKRKQIGLRAMSTILAAVLLMAGMSTANLPIRDMSVSAKTLAELQDERQANEAKIAEKQKKLDSLQSNMNENEQYQKTLKEKIALQQENLDIVSEELKRIGTSISETEDAIAQAEDDITVMEADIAIGLDEFKMRLRAMYVQGNDSLASALVGATDFYDLLSKYELMSRVANHDNDLVNTLKDKLETCNEKKAQLEKQQENLSKQQSDQQAKKDEFSAALMDLQDTYSETSDAQEQMEREKESLNADVSTLEKQNAELDAEEAEIKAAIAKAAEEQKRKEEEARKQKEKEAAEAAAAAQRQQEAQQQQQQNNSSANSNSNSNSSGNSNSNSNSSNTIPAATITTAAQRPARITTIAAAATAALVLHGRARGSIPFPAAMSPAGGHSTVHWILPAETTAQPLSLLVAVPLLWLSADARITTASPPAAAAAADTETMW